MYKLPLPFTSGSSPWIFTTKSTSRLDAISATLSVPEVWCIDVILTHPPKHSTNIGYTFIVCRHNNLINILRLHYFSIYVLYKILPVWSLASLLINLPGSMVDAYFDGIMATVLGTFFIIELLLFKSSYFKQYDCFSCLMCSFIKSTL